MEFNYDDILTDDFLPEPTPAPSLVIEDPLPSPSSEVSSSPEPQPGISFAPDEFLDFLGGFVETVAPSETVPPADELPVPSDSLPLVADSPVLDDLPADPEMLEGYTFDGIETFALSPITDANGLKGIMLDILGDYDNIVTQYRYISNSSSNYSYVNQITPDYPWIFSAVLFIILVWSVFRILGVFLQWLK